VTYNRLPEVGSGLRLHLNENTGGCSPAVLRALATLSPAEIAFYPDYGPITTECEGFFGVPAGCVQLTNGLDEGLQVVAQRAALVHMDQTRAASHPFESIVVEPAFEMYAACTESAGGRVVRVPSGPDLDFPADAVLRAISERTRLVYLTDPNNPSGRAIPAPAVRQIAAAAPHALVLVDEAYGDFSRQTFIGPDLDRFPNLVVGRTFAKAYGLAALRVGALVANRETLDAFRRILPPYSINVCAIHGLTAALRDRAFLTDYVSQSARSRELVYAFCESRQLKYWRSDANFVLIRVGPDAAGIARALADRGVFVRDRSQQPGCAGCIRITAGVVDHTRECLAALEDVIASSAR
jgi:histidinol-phosphate aminotransferase